MKGLNFCCAHGFKSYALVINTPPFVTKENNNKVVKFCVLFTNCTLGYGAFCLAMDGVDIASSIASWGQRPDPS